MAPSKVGQRFGMLVVTDMLEADYGRTRYRCRCDCGARFVSRSIGSNHGARSCGCLKKLNGRKAKVA